MIVEVTVSEYKGIYAELVKGKGWKCNLGGNYYLFPTLEAAHSAIDDCFENLRPILRKHGGIKYKE